MPVRGKLGVQIVTFVLNANANVVFLSSTSSFCYFMFLSRGQIIETATFLLRISESHEALTSVLHMASPTKDLAALM